MLKKPKMARQPKLLWLASGKNDVLYDRTKDTLKLLHKCKIPYVYVEGKGLHDWQTARNHLFVLAPLLFRDAD